MDPCPFVRILVGNIALKLTGASKPARSGVHPSSSPCFCKIQLGKLPCRTATLPLLSQGTPFPEQQQSITLAAVFDLSGKLIAAGGRLWLKISVYKGRRGETCGVSSGRLIGRVKVPVDISREVAERAWVFHDGWIALGKKEEKGDFGASRVHLTVRSDPDPRFVFEFGGRPESSPQVFQKQGSLKQPVFTCKFSCRSSGGDLIRRSRSLPLEKTSSSKWLASFGSDHERPGKERKGWSISVHDLSGAPVALAAMVTPFVATPGSDRVSSSNPGAWLILRPSSSTWKPYARLEAWRVRDRLAFRFELHPDSSTSATVLAETSLSASKGGTFTVDLTGEEEFECFTPRGSVGFGMGIYPFSRGRGFVMSTAVGGEKRKKGGRVGLEVSAQQVACMEDAAAFVALSAAVELSVDACRPFSGRMKKELLTWSRVSLL